jgi:hypothetical protein
MSEWPTNRNLYSVVPEKSGGLNRSVQPHLI